MSDNRITSNHGCLLIALNAYCAHQGKAGHGKDDMMETDLLQRLDPRLDQYEIAVNTLMSRYCQRSAQVVGYLSNHGPGERMVEGQVEDEDGGEGCDEGDITDQAAFVNQPSHLEKEFCVQSGTCLT